MYFSNAKTSVLILTVIILISFGVSTFSSIISLSNLLEKSSSKEAQLFIEEVKKDISESENIYGTLLRFQNLISVLKMQY